MRLETVTEGMQFFNCDIFFPFVQVEQTSMDQELFNGYGAQQISDIQISDIKSIPSLQPMIVAFPKEVIESVSETYFDTTELILSGNLDPNTSIQDLSDIQVLLLIRGDNFSTEDKKTWQTKLRPRFATIDINLILEYL